MSTPSSGFRGYAIPELSGPKAHSGRSCALASAGSRSRTDSAMKRVFIYSPLSTIRSQFRMRIRGAVIAVRSMRGLVMRGGFVMKAQEIHAVVVTVGCPDDGMD